MGKLPVCSFVCAPHQVTSDVGFVLCKNSSSAHRHLLGRGDCAVTGWQNPGLVPRALHGKAMRLEVRCCRVLSPLWESVPKHLCHLKIKTKCQMTVVPWQLSILSLEDIDQRPKNELVMRVQVSLLPGCKSLSRRDWRTWAVLLCL